MFLILARTGDAGIGYGLAFDIAEHPFMPEWTRSGYITQFYVAPEHRKQGVGKLLMNDIDKWFNSRGIQKVLLNVNINNETGSRFWQNHGFKSYATRMVREQK